MIDYKLLCLCMILPMSTSTPEKCGYIHLSVSASNNTIVMNWRFDCLVNQRRFVLTHANKVLARKKIWSDRERISRKVTNVTWDYNKLPGDLYLNSTRLSRLGTLCFMYHMSSYKAGKLEDKQCLMVNFQWMSKFDRFGELRIGYMYIPGTHNSASTGRHQHYDIWSQLIFGIRYFDLPVVATRNQYGKVVFRTLHASNPLEEHLKVIRKFFEVTYREIVIIDIRDFHDFKSRKDHILLTKMITKYLGKWMAKRNISTHRYGPTLLELWENDKRLIVNYRYPPIVKNSVVLWDNITILNGETTTPKGLHKHMNETLTDRTYREMMRVYVAVLHPGQYDDERKLADRVNPKLSNWYFLAKLQNRINIFAVDFFEASRMHVDAVWINKEHD